MEVKKSKNVILDKSFAFSLEIIKFCELLNENRKFILANQLLKSGTSIGANVREAQSPQSRADFIHKLKIAIKEVEETEYWLELINQSEGFPNCADLLEKNNELRLIISKIISSSKNNYVKESEHEYFTDN